MKTKDIVFKFDEFEGPLDLLLHLISKNKLSIVDVSLAKITDQYFEYINSWQEENIDFSSEFLVVASELLYIKSKFLLPKHDEEEGSADDNEKDLLQRLKEYKLFKKTAEKIKDRQFESKYIFFRLAEPIKFKAKPMKEMPKEKLVTSLFGLAERKALMLPPGKENLKDVMVKKPASIFAKVKDILKSIKRKTRLKYKEIFRGTKSDRVASFLALLELIKLSRVKFEGEGEDITITDVKR